MEQGDELKMKAELHGASVSKLYELSRAGSLGTGKPFPTCEWQPLGVMLDPFVSEGGNAGVKNSRNVCCHKSSYLQTHLLWKGSKHGESGDVGQKPIAGLKPMAEGSVGCF